MTRKFIGWITLSVCVVTVAVAVFAGQVPTQQPAQNVAPPQQANVVPTEKTQACQAVMSRIVTIQQTILDEKRSRTIKPQTAMDELVAQEYQINTSKCPTDFRMAVLRFVMVEDTARVHAHMDDTGKADEFLAASVEVFASHGLLADKALQSVNSYHEKIADEQKQDLANIQSAFLDLAQLAMNYGVK